MTLTLLSMFLCHGAAGQEGHYGVGHWGLPHSRAQKIEPLLCARIAKRSRSSAAAQFEREVIGERIRDKVRGLPQEGHVDRWMGWY
jgi:hypothetical protein